MQWHVFAERELCDPVGVDLMLSLQPFECEIIRYGVIAGVFAWELVFGHFFQLLVQRIQSPLEKNNKSWIPINTKSFQIVIGHLAQNHHNPTQNEWIPTNVPIFSYIFYVKLRIGHPVSQSPGCLTSTPRCHVWRMQWIFGSHPRRQKKRPIRK